MNIIEFEGEFGMCRAVVSKDFDEALIIHFNVLSSLCYATFGLDI